MQLAAAGGVVGVAPSVRIIPTRIVHSLAEAYAHCNELQLQGKEGTVLKNGAGFWKDTDSGNPDVVKLKLEVDVDLISKGIVAGKDSTKNEGRAGSITMETSDGLLRVDVTVKNEKLCDAIDANPEDFLGRVWAVRFNSIMKPSPSNDLHSLFLPRMVEAGYRIDKSEADSLESVFEQFDNASRGGVPAELEKVAA
ncbi:hypothetical protein [Paraburkholderia flagellata]|uniref:hypothetical protein n=1 Tax=Paraburkholderia flagellata TaxID=2883241 RepID=UPI001F368804|nr:hypothetical protein [Paraburkholderia flagellata]